MLPLYEISRGLAQGFIDGLLERGPQIIAFVRQLRTTTLTDAADNPALTDALRQEQSQAMADGVLPPADVR